MTFGEYYRDTSRSAVSPAKAMEEARDNILSRLNNKATVEQCKKLETFFNHAFYPEKYGQGDGSQYYTNIIRAVEAAYQQKYNTALNNFSMGASDVTYGVQPDGLPQLIRERHEAFVHKEKIYISTLESRLNRVKQVLNQIDASNGGAVLDDLKKDLVSLQSNLQNLLNIKDVQTNKNGAFLDLEHNDDLYQAVQIIDAQFEAASQVGGIFGPRDYGQILEWVLQAFDASTEPLIEEIGEDIIQKELIDKMTKTAGSDTTGKNGLSVSINGIKYDTDYIKKPPKSGEVTISNGTESFSFKYTQGFKPDSDRQGKMDVNFTFNDEGTYVPFRISAKNWKTLDRDFGSTPLIYALLRTLGDESATEYAFAMQDEKNDNVVKSSHQMAKYAIIADILMGYSQENNYADTLLINDRAASRVIVVSLVDLMEKIYSKIEDQKIQGYNDDVIHNRMIILRQAVAKAKQSRSSMYKSLAYKYMQSVQTAVHFANISPHLGL